MAGRLPPDMFAIYFSGYSAHAVEVEGTLYPSVEHAYHCMRYEDPEITEQIRSARSPRKAWEVSQKFKPVQRPDFSARKVEVMKKLCRAKLEQHDDVRTALIDSQGLDIVKHITTGTPADGFWDDGADGKGENHVGKIWMELRKEISA